MKKKMGLTLIELMAGLVVFFIFISAVSSSFLKSYGLNIRNEKLQIIQDEYRNTIMEMENKIENKESDQFNFYVYEEGKRCAINSASLKSEVDNKSIFDGTDKATPLISIVPKSPSGGSIYTYVVIEERKGEDITNRLEQIEVQSVNNLKGLQSEDIKENNFIITPKSKKTLMNNVSLVNIVRNKDDNNLIEMNIKIKVFENKNREYKSSFKIDNHKDIVINIKKNEDNNGGETEPPISDEVINDFINNLGENNINISGSGIDSVEIKFNGLEIGTAGGGSIGYNNITSQDINEIKEVIRMGTVGLNENKILNNIKYKSNVKSDIVIHGTNDIEGKPLYKESVKTEQPGIVADIILVNGDVTISPRKHKNNVYLKNTVIIATGDIILENSFSPGKNGRAVLTDCIVYGTKLKANIHGQIMIDNSYWFTPPKGILHYEPVRTRTAEILGEYLLKAK